MKKKLGPFVTVVSVLLTVASCGSPNKAEHNLEKPDAALFTNSVPPESYSLQGCHDRIAKLVCFKKSASDNSCRTDVDLANAVTSLQGIYDAYPVALQAVFCRIGRIYLEPDFQGTAYASGSEGKNAAVVGIRSSLLLSTPVPSLASWVTWKEQLSFGGDFKSYKTRDDLVKVVSSMALPAATSDFLYYVLAHEFGHVLDFQYGITQFKCETADANCPVVKDSYSAISWAEKKAHPKSEDLDPWHLDEYTPNESGQFLNRDQLCFYACPAGHGSPELMHDLYSSLQQSTFITGYSSTNPYDDFAEYMAFYSGTTRARLEYKIELPTGEIYDLAQKLRMPEAKEKRQWIENFLKRAETDALSGATSPKILATRTFED